MNLDDLWNQSAVQTTPTSQPSSGLLDALWNNSQAPANEQPSVVENPGSHPTYGAPVYNNNPLTASLKGLYQGGSGLVNTLNNLREKMPGQAPLGPTVPNPLFAGIRNTPDARPGTGAGIAQDIGKGVVSGAPVMAGGMFGPLGMGAVAGVEAYANNQNVPLAVAQNVLLGKVWQLTGSLGSGAFVSAAKKLGIPEDVAAKDFLQRAGSALGAGATSGAISQGDPASIIQGGMFGSLYPSESFGTNKNYGDVLQNASKTQQYMLNLGKGVIQKVEMKSGKDLQDSYDLAAQHGLIYNKMDGNKLDTTQAQEQLQPVISALNDKANAIVSSDPTKTYDLKQIGINAKAALKSNPLFKNDLAYNNAQDQVDAHIQAAIANRGQFVSAEDLNDIKQGMWKQSFEPLQPNNNAVARQLGNTAMTALNKDFSGLQDVNSKLGKYLDLNAVLINAHGNTVKGGRLGTGFGGGIGAATGIAASHFAPNPEVAGLMTLGGTKLGMMASDYLNDPSVISKYWANKVKLSQTANGINPVPDTTFTPREKEALGLPYHAPVPDYLQQRQNEPLSSLGVNGENPYMSGGYHQPLNPILKLMYDRNPAGRENIPSKNIPPSTPMRPVPNESGIEQFSTPKESIEQRGVSARAQSPSFAKSEDIPPEVKDQVKEGINKYWLGHIMGQFNPLNKINNEKGFISIGDDPRRFSEEELKSSLKHYQTMADWAKGNDDRSQLRDAQTMVQKIKNTLSGLGKGALPAIVAGGLIFGAQPQASANSDLTKQFEGLRLSPYKDTKGNLTIGYGTEISAHPELKGVKSITKETALNYFHKDYSEAEVNAKKFLGSKTYSTLSPTRQQVLTDMAYNIHNRLNKFTKLKQAIISGDFNTAADEMKNSLWHSQVKSRAIKLEDMMRNNQ